MKNSICNKCSSCGYCMNRENRRLKRALWLARAEIAHATTLHWNVYCYQNNCIYFRDFMPEQCNPFIRSLPKKTAMEWSDLWESIETKCRAKAKELEEKMSELKHQLMLNKERSWVPAYLKSEADKVIAEKDEENYNIKYSRDEWAKVCNQKDKEIDLYKRGWEESDKINAHLYAKLRHQKYKRCLAMANFCEIQHDYYGSDFWWRWYRRWLNLANKFKEAK